MYFQSRVILVFSVQAFLVVLGILFPVWNSLCAELVTFPAEKKSFKVRFSFTLLPSSDFCFTYYQFCIQYPFFVCLIVCSALLLLCKVVPAAVVAVSVVCLYHWQQSSCWQWLFPRVRGFCENVRQIISPLRLFFLFFFLSGDQFVQTNSTPQARISPQWLTELRRL